MAVKDERSPLVESSSRIAVGDLGAKLWLEIFGAAHFVSKPSALLAPWIVTLLAMWKKLLLLRSGRPNKAWLFNVATHSLMGMQSDRNPRAREKDRRVLSMLVWDCLTALRLK